MPSSWLNVGSAWSSRVVNVYDTAAVRCAPTAAAWAEAGSRASPAPLAATAAASAPATTCFLMGVTPCLQAEVAPTDPAPPANQVDQVRSYSLPPGRLSGHP